MLNCKEYLDDIVLTQIVECLYCSSDYGNVISYTNLKSACDAVDILRFDFDFSVDLGISKTLGDTSKEREVYRSILKNLEDGKRLLDSVYLSELSCLTLGIGISIIVEESKTSRKRIKKFLDSYLNDFENRNLYSNNKNVASLENHYREFKGLIYNYQERYGDKNINVDFDMISSFAPEAIMKPLEYFLLMDKKRLIKIKWFENAPQKKVYKWKLRMDILKEYSEMESLYNNWLTFANLSFRPDSGHACNGALGKKYFNKDHQGYKLLNHFMNNPEKKFPVSELEEVTGEDKSHLDKKTRVNNLRDNINKQIIKPLNLNDDKSRVNILSSEGMFFLSAIPDRL